MADVTDPNAAPMHHDIQERFASFHVVLALFLGLAASAAGIILGVILVND